MSRVHWTVVTTYAGGLEADIAVETLKSVGILAVRRDNDTAGLFGPGFQGPSARGASVLAPSSEAEEAREILGVTPGEREATELAQWEDPSHWNGDGSYESADDSRLFVSKRASGFGWTLNMAHRRAQKAIWIFLLAVVAAAIVLGYTAVG
jgi:hypothetical protein